MFEVSSGGVEAEAGIRVVMLCCVDPANRSLARMEIKLMASQLICAAKAKLLITAMRSLGIILASSVTELELTTKLPMV